MSCTEPLGRGGRLAAQKSCSREIQYHWYLIYVTVGLGSAPPRPTSPVNHPGLRVILGGGLKLRVITCNYKDCNYNGRLRPRYNRVFASPFGYNRT